MMKRRSCFGATYWALFLVGDVRDCTGDRGEKKWPSHTLNLNRRAHLLMTTAPSRADLTISRTFRGGFWSDIIGRPGRRHRRRRSPVPAQNAWYWAATEKDVSKTRHRLKSLYISEGQIFARDAGLFRPRDGLPCTMNLKGRELGLLHNILLLE